jgi:predicted thioesterase
VTLSAGLVGELTASVEPAMLASAIGSGGLDVFSTPSLIALMEHAARNAVEHLLAPDQLTVGRRLVFRVEAFDPQEKIGEGVHERAIVDPARLVARAAAKLPQD